MAKKELQWLIDRAFNMDSSNEAKVIKTLKILNGLRLKQYDYDTALTKMVDLGCCPSVERYERSTQTLYKSYGLILEKDIISKIGIELAEGRITFKEMLLMQLFKKQYRNADGYMVRPLIIVLKVLLKLQAKDEAEAWLDSFDYFNYLTEIFKYEEIDIAVEKIIEARRNNTFRVVDDIKDADIWANAFISSGLFVKNNSSNNSYKLNNENIELAKFIADNHDKSLMIESEWMKNFTDPYRGIAEIFPNLIDENENRFKINNFSFDVIQKVINNRIIYGLSQRENDQNVFFNIGVYEDSNRGFISQAILKAAGLSSVKLGVFSFLKNYPNILLYCPQKLYDVIKSYPNNSINSFQTYWLLSANSKIYDHESSFDKFGEIDWYQNRLMKSISVNDIVFIYVAAPTSKVKYKCKVVAIDIPKDEAIDDSEFWLVPKKEECDKFLKLKLLGKTDDDRLLLEKLIERGLKAAPEGPVKLDKEKYALAIYINSIFESEEEVIQEANKAIEANFEIHGDATNLIVFGTPGCGKSYYVDNELLKDFKKDNIFRTTFYQDYTNTDFVGQILPYVEKDTEGKEKRVTYEFNPGPFALALKQAVLHKDEKVALVVEELNRGNAPAIFGDVFQLLDRDENGISRFEVTNINLRDYLNRELDANFDKIKIPGNLYIYATMNTSDQNVFTLDTAFKRRWESLKLKNTFDTYIDALGYEHKHDYKSYKVPGLQDVTWQQFVDTINKAIEGVEGERDSSINVSDKKLGVYFIDKNGLYQEELQLEDLNDRSKAEKFAYKVFSYLWDDVAKFDKDKLFAKGIITLDDLIAKYIKHEVIFNPSLQEKLYPPVNQKDSDSSETK